MTQGNATTIDARSAPPTHPADRLFAAIDRVGSPACVGLDPVLEKLPAECRDRGEALSAIEHFCSGVLEAIAPHVGVCKIQSACFERYGAVGVGVRDAMLTLAREYGLHVILDAKRGDIGISAQHYAASVHEHADWVTVNPYLGVDGIEPFLEAENLGAFALVRTSNPGGDALQSLKLADGDTVADAVAGLIAQAGERSVGASGYSALGAVVGATKHADAKRLRERMSQQVFLVPGFGAQGGGVQDVLPCFDSAGRGAVVTASRSVIYASDGETGSWKSAVERAAAAFAAELAAGIESA